ncbi:MAG: GTPase Era [Lachnospiraceae bacterium]|nr:GTPase Era [Lachnospiraceae bacterium]
MENANFKSGFVTLIGRPNVGKSTLMNHLIGQKIAITSNKPQTTRNRIQTVYTSEQGQIIFLDTPGIHKAKNKLGEYMVTAAESTLREVDVVLWLVEPTDSVGGGDQHIAQMLRAAAPRTAHWNGQPDLPPTEGRGQYRSTKIPVILILNKMDTVAKSEIPRYLDVYRELLDFDAVIPVCALRGLHMDEVISAIFRCLPYGPKYYDDDTVTDQPQKQIVAELIREKTLRCMEEEIPHGIAVSIEVMKERPAGSQKHREKRAEAVRKKHRHEHAKKTVSREVEQNGQPGLLPNEERKDFQGKKNGRTLTETRTNVDDTLSRREQAEVDVRETSDWIMDIEATIICEKESHKGMVIGKQGAMLRKIGSQARYEIEQMLEEPVNLQLWVKVKKDWRDSDYMIKNFGYDKTDLV